MVDSCYYTFVQPIECPIPRMNPNVNYGRWVIMMYQCRFISCKKGTTLMGDVDSRRGFLGEVSVLSTHFCCEPKTALKNKVLKMK